MISIFILSCVILVCYGARAVPTALRARQSSLTIACNVVPSTAKNLNGPYTSELILTNNGQQSVANHGWQIYFNFCRKILPANDTEPIRIVHVNGDLFRMEPDRTFQALRPGTARTIRFQTDAPLIKETDAPSGFYMVRYDDVRQEKVVESLGEASFGPIADQRRSMRTRDDKVPVPTPQSRFVDNLELLPPSDEVLRRIVPSPVQFESLPGTTEIHRDTVIVASERLRNEAEYLANALKPLLGFKLAIQNSESGSFQNAIVLSIQDITVDGVPKAAGDHAYRLNIEPGKKIAIEGTDPPGVFYGVQSLRACLSVENYKGVSESITVSGVSIEDAPRFPYRGLHLDVARNFQSSNSVKKLLELMAFYKLNKFHFHLTDDEGWRIEIQGLPELTEVGGKRGYSESGTDGLQPSFGSGPDAEAADSQGSGFYSRQEFVDILRFAAERHIEVIPEIDLPGHARAAIQAMKVRRERLIAKGLIKEADEFLLHDPEDRSKYESVQLWNDNVVNVCLESTYRFIKHVLIDIESMFVEADLKLKTVHLGGDEVPEGVWVESPICRNEHSDMDKKIDSGKLAMSDFFAKAAGYNPTRSDLVVGAWEEVFLNDLRKSQAFNDRSQNRFANSRYQSYVWNNVWGWGQEDAAYRLANAGVNVVLCNATHLYFDLAYNKDAQEPGYYWAGFVETKAPYSFAPMNYLAKSRRDIFGHEISLESINRRLQLTEEGKKHILGIQGQLWGENLKGQDRLEYMALPRLVALAERAWAAEPEWSSDNNPDEWPRKFQQSWSDFAHQLGGKELPRLDYLQGGYHYRIPDAGAIIEDQMLEANVDMPGLTIRYTTDNTDPDIHSELYTEPVRVGTMARVRVFATNGRGGRTSLVQERVFLGN